MISTSNETDLVNHGMLGLHAEDLNQEMIETTNTDLEPTTDLGLTLGYRSQCIQRNLNRDSGAGVNAVSRLNLALAATDPLAEIVWSPHKGLSLRCADYSFFSKKSSHFWDAGPNIMVLSPQQGTARITDGNNLLGTQDTFQAESEIPEADPLVKSSASNDGNMSECGPSQGRNKGSERGARDKKDKLSGGRNSSTRENDLDMHGQESGGAADVVSSRKELNGTDNCGGTNVSLSNEKMQGRGELTLETDRGNNCNTRSLGIKLEESASADKEEANNQTEKVDTTNSHPLERQESMDENDLQALNLDTVLDAATKSLVPSGCCQALKNRSQQNGKPCHEDKNTKNRVKMDQKKLKGKLYDEEANKRVSQEDDESHGSVESCNSAGLFSSGTKRCNFGEQFVDGSKRVKKMHISDSPSSSAFNKNDSSFMSWISNVVKGFTKSVEDEAPYLALTHHPDNRYEFSNEKPTAHNIEINHGRQNTGFKSVFRSLYTSNIKSSEVGNAPPSYAGEGSKKPELVNNDCVVGATPLACHGGDVCQSVVPLRKCEWTEGSGSALFTRQEGPSHVFSLENSGTKSAENKNVDGPLFPNEKNVSTSTSNNPEMKSAGNLNPDLIAGQKPTQNFGKGSDLLSSLWVKRFSTKCSGSLPSHNNLDEDTSLALDFPADNSRFLLHSKNLVGVSNDHIVEETREKTTDDLPALTDKKLQNESDSAEASVGFDTARGYNSSKSIQNSPLPSLRNKNSEAMASSFAKRLNALKHISTLDATHVEASANMTCFFCGAKGHHLQSCLEVPGSKVKGLSSNISSCNNAEKPPSHCIKSFQLSHWSVTSRNLHSKGKRKSESSALMEPNHPSEIPLDLVNDSYIKMQERRRRLSMDADAHTTYLDSYIRMQERESCAMVVSNHAARPEDFVASSSGGNKLDENKLLTFANPISCQNTHMPKEMFDLVKQLRLSRAAILNLSLMNSHISTSHINGFFLRLRLGKWEEGLGGTGYYVALIKGVEVDKQSDGTKNRISVNVGGINSLVDSQYISNNDFLQEELTAWWYATLRSGGQIPSEEDLRAKVEERKKLGF